MSQGGSSLLASFVIVALLLRAGDEAPGRSTENANTSTDLAPAGYRTTVRGSPMRRPALDTPESTFKVLTLASALENGLAWLDTSYDSPGRMDSGGADVVSIGARAWPTSSP